MESEVSKKYNCNIKVLSPVHIGAGNSYSMRECAYYKGDKDKPIKNRIDLTSYYASLPEKDRETFLDEIVTDEFNLNEFHQKLLDEETRWNSIIKGRNEDKYESLDSFIRYTFRKKTKRGNLDIIETAKTLDKVYIPGSSLKGAIRTALLYNSIDDRIIKDFVRWNSKHNKEELNFSKFNSYVEEFFSENKRDLAKTDVLKYLSVLDSNGHHIPIVYQVNQIRAAYDLQYNLKGIEDGTKAFLETISFEGLKKTDSLNTELHIEFNKDYINDSFERFLDIESIKESIHEFSKDLIEYEMNFAKKFHLKYLIDFYDDLRIQNEPTAPVLRIGAGSGLMGTSIALKIKNYDEDVYYDLFNIRDGTIYPRSRRIALTKLKPTEGIPLGWVKLSFEEMI